MTSESATLNTGTGSILVSESFSKGNKKVLMSGGTMALSGSNLAQQANITLSGGTISFQKENFITDGLVADFDASFMADGDVTDGTVHTWTDRHQGRVATANNTNIKYSVDETLGMNVIEFPTSGNSGFVLDTPISDIRSVFWVLKDDTLTNQSFMLGDSYWFNFHRAANGHIWYDHAQTAAVRGGLNILNGENIGDGTSTRLTGGWDLFSTAENTANLTASTISMDRNISERSWDGSMAEILIYNRCLSADEVSLVNTYLNTKWGLGHEAAGVITDTFDGSDLTYHVTADTRMNLSGFSAVTLGAITTDSDIELGLIADADEKIAFTSSVGGAGFISKYGEGEITLTGDGFNPTNGIAAYEGLLSLDGETISSVFVDDTGKFQALGDSVIRGGLWLEGTLLADLQDVPYTLENALLIAPGAGLEFLNIPEPVAGYSHDIFNNLGLVEIMANLESLLPSEMRGLWNLDYSGGVMTLSVDANAVPEPATYGLLLGGMLMLLWRRRRG